MERTGNEKKGKKALSSRFIGTRANGTLRDTAQCGSHFGASYCEGDAVWIHTGPPI
jgi:hypothetical protein